LICQAFKWWKLHNWFCKFSEWSQTETCSVQSVCLLYEKKSVQHRVPRPEADNLHYFWSTLVFAGHYL
jgi:hypothetical protein